MLHIIWISAQHASVWMHLWWPNPHSVYHGRSKWFGDLSMQGLETRESRWNCSKGKSIGLCSNCPLTFPGYILYIRYKCEKMQTYPQTTAKTFCTMYCCPLLQCPLNLLGLWVFFWSFYILYPSSLTFLCRFSSSFNLQDYCPRRHSSCGQIFHLHQGRAHLQVFLSKKKPSEATEIGGWLKRKKKNHSEVEEFDKWKHGDYQWLLKLCDYHAIALRQPTSTTIRSHNVNRCKSYDVGRFHDKHLQSSSNTYSVSLYCRPWMSTKTKPIESRFSQLRWKSRPSRVIASSWPSNRPFLGAIFANKPIIRCGPKWSVMSSSHIEFVLCEKTCLPFFLTVFHKVLLTFRHRLVIWAVSKKSQKNQGQWVKIWGLTRFCPVVFQILIWLFTWKILELILQPKRLTRCVPSLKSYLSLLEILFTTDWSPGKNM